MSSDRGAARARTLTLVLALGAVLGLVLLASGLRSLEFEPAHRLPSRQPTGIRPQLTLLAREIAQIPIWKLAFFWGLMIGILGLIVSVLSPEVRKALLRSMIRAAAFAFILMFALQRNPGLLAALEPAAPVGAAGEAGVGVAEEPPAYTPPRLSALTVYLVSLGMLLAVGAAAWAGSRWWSRKRFKGGGKFPLADLGTIARQSLDDLMGGQDWGNAIIRCYDQMSRVVDKRRGLARAASMTPTEFASRLQGAGLPAEPVRRLTQLFERARYGAREPGRAEIDEAAACLTSIALFCGEAL